MRAGQLPFIMLLLLFCIKISMGETISLDKLPINPVVISQVETSLNRLLRYLNFKKINNKELYQRVKRCQIQLQNLSKQQVINYNNMIMGNGNKLQGINNIVLGSKNKLQGNKNWVFTKFYTGNADRTLIVDKWQINLNKIMLIKTDPSLAIVQWQNIGAQ